MIRKDLKHMSRDCKDCEYFGGWNESDGTPYCGYEGEYEFCPFNSEANAAEKNTMDGVKIEIDAKFLTEYVRETLKNTVHSVTRQMVEKEIVQIVTDTYKEQVKVLTKNAIEKVVDAQVTEFMGGDITIGGGWREPERTITRTAYMSELIEMELSKRFDSDKMKGLAEQEARTAIDRFSRSLKEDINSGVKQYFDAATRQVLTENVVSMLMSNDTYRRLSDSMNSFLPGAGSDQPRPV